MGQVLFQENVPVINKDSVTQLSLPSTYSNIQASAIIGGQGYTWSSTLVMNAATTGIGGLDTGTLGLNALYYVYLVANTSNVVGLVASLNAPNVGPTGFAQYKEIARFRTFVGTAQIAWPINRFLGNARQEDYSSNWITYTGELTGTGTATFVVSGLSRVNRYRIVNNSIDVTFHRAFLTAGSGAGSIQVPLPDNITFNAFDHPALENRVGTRYAFNATSYVAVAAVIARSAVIFLENTGTATYLKGSDIPAGYEVAVDIKGLSVTELVGIFD